MSIPKPLRPGRQPHCLCHAQYSARKIPPMQAPSREDLAEWLTTIAMQHKHTCTIHQLAEHIVDILLGTTCPPSLSIEHKAPYITVTDRSGH